MNQLRLIALSLCALLAVAPAADAARGKKKVKAKYFFVAHQTILSVTTSECKTGGNKQYVTTETSTVERFSEHRGYLGGTMSETGWNQTTLERTGNDPQLPPSKSQTPKIEFEFEDLAAGRSWRKGSETATYNYGIIGNEYKIKLRLPRVNREFTKSFDKTYRNESSSDARCSYTDKVTIKGGVTLQRIQ